jgi:gluconokinase
MASTGNQPLIIALDIGTSSTRALLYDARGRMQPNGEVKIEYRQHLTPDGGVECDADRLLTATLSAVKQLIRKTSAYDRGRITAAGISCFWHALLGVDGSGDPVTPVYSWADTRSRSEIERLSRVLLPQAYHDRTGAFVHAAFWPAKIAWLRRSQPHLADRVKRWLSFPDFLMDRLCGQTVTSISIASGTGLMNEAAAAWDEETLSAISIDSDSLPKIAAPGETFRLRGPKLIPGLPDVAWYPAYGDGACSNIGSGGVSDKRVVVNVSTSGAIRVLCPKPDRRVAPSLFRYRLDDRRWVIGGAMSNGGNVNAWLERTLRLDDAAKLDRMLLSATPDCHGLTVLPFWAGERSPGWHAEAKASIVGLNLSTSAVDIAQASLESIAYTFRSQRDDITSAFPMATEMIVSGGAVEHSRYMPRLLANVLDAPVRISLDPEPSGRGAALAVAEQLGSLADIANASDHLSRPIDPDPAATEVYDRARSRFKQLYDKLIAAPTVARLR